MTVDVKHSLAISLESAASRAGLILVSNSEGSDFYGRPTAVFQLGLPGGEVAGRSLKLELSEGFDFDQPDLLPMLTSHLADEAKRLRNPQIGRAHV